MLWKTCFSPSQNAENESQLKLKNQVRNRLLIDRFSSMKDYTCHYAVSKLKTNVYINFNKIIVKFEIFFTPNRVFKQKGVVSNLHVCCNGIGKMWASFIFYFFTRNSKPHTWKNLKFFLHNICRNVQHSIFSSR